MSSTAKIEKTIARQKERIAEGDFYEAHQQLRVIASRYIKSANYNAAADILSGGAKALLQAGHGGSGGDLSLMLLNEVYEKGNWECSEANKARLLEILKTFPSTEPTRKRYIQETLGWSGKHSSVERGDPDLQDAVGKLFAEGIKELLLASSSDLSDLSSVESEPYDTERHLPLGHPSSATALATSTYTWYTSDSPHLAPLYLSRAVFPYLLLGNLSSANLAYSTFTSLLTSANPHLFTQSVSTTRSELRVFPSMPLMNFLGLLLLSCQKGDAKLFRDLAKHYAINIKEVEVWGWGDALAQIGEAWFGIRIPRQGGNPLFDMMGSMLFGGGGGGGGGGAANRPSTPSTTPAPKETKRVEAGSGNAGGKTEMPQVMDID